MAGQVRIPIARASTSIPEVECDGQRWGCCEWRCVCGDSVAVSEALAPYLDPLPCLWVGVDGHGEASMVWT